MEAKGTTKPRLTPHQKWAFQHLARLSARADAGWVLAKDSGSPAAMEHLYHKGYAERKIKRGPRGGEHRLYRPVFG